jgi:hypothetical protein
MMNKIFGGLEVGVVTGSTTTSIIGSGVSTASFLQLIPKKSKDERSRIFLFILDRFGGNRFKRPKVGLYYFKLTLFSIYILQAFFVNG